MPHFIGLCGFTCCSPHNDWHQLRLRQRHTQNFPYHRKFLSFTFIVHYAISTITGDDSEVKYKWSRPENGKLNPNYFMIIYFSTSLEQWKLWARQLTWAPSSSPCRRFYPFKIHSLIHLIPFLIHYVILDVVVVVLCRENDGEEIQDFLLCHSRLRRRKSKPFFSSSCLHSWKNREKIEGKSLIVQLTPLSYILI